MRTCLILGATGLIGNKLLKSLINQSDFERIVTITRKRIDSCDRHKNYVVSDFSNNRSTKIYLKSTKFFTV